MGKIVQIIFGILWFIVGIIGVTLTWTWASILAGLIDDGVYLAMYWIGYIVMFFLIIILPAYTLVMDGYKDEEA